jgi:FtsH-binding integral membrane protein
MKMTGQYVGTYETLSMGSFIVSSRAFYIFIFIISFVLLIALLCFKNTYPVNYCLLGAWTLSISFSVATACVVVLCDPMVVTGRQEILPFSLAKDGTPGGLTLFQGSVYCAVGTASEKSGTNSVLLAVAITTAIFLSLTVFTFQSKWDFSFLGAGLGASLWILILWGIGMSLFGGGLGEMRYWYRCAVVCWLLTGPELKSLAHRQLVRGYYLLSVHHL